MFRNFHFLKINRIMPFCNLFIERPSYTRIGYVMRLRFREHFRGLGATYDVNLRLIEKRIVDFLSMLIELFSLGVTAEAL